MNSTTSAEEKGKSISKAIVKVIIQIVVIGVMAYFVFNNFLYPVTVSGSSMEPTLHSGDVLFTQRVFYEPDYDDIVVVIVDESYRYAIKRVIGLENDVIKIDYKNNTIYVNGLLMSDPHKKEPMRNIHSNNNEAVITFTVPENHIFVLGDNRNNSQDSRDPSFGYIQDSRVFGKAISVK